MKRKFVSILLALLMIMSVLPMAFAEDYADDVSQDEEEIAFSESEEEIAREKPSLEVCVSYFSELYPRVSDKRIEDACQKARLHVVNSDKREVVKEVDTVDVDRPRPGVNADGVKVKAKATKAVVHKRINNVKDQHADKFAGLDAQKLDKLNKLSRAQLAKYAAMSDEELKSRLDNLRVRTLKAEDFYRARKLSDEALRDANKKFDEKDSEYKRLVAELASLRNDFKEAASNDDDEAAIEIAKEYLNKVADAAIRKMESIIAQIEGNDDIDEQRASEMIEDLENKISELEDAKEKVNAATTKEEVREAGKTIVEAWKKIQYKVKQHASYHSLKRLEEFFKKIHRYEVRLESAVDSLEEDGVDVAELNAVIDEFSAKVDSAKESLRKAEELYKSNVGEDRSKENVQEAKALIREAHKDLREAHQLFRKAVAMLKDLGFNKDDVTREEKEIEVIEEEYVEEEDASEEKEEEEEDYATEDETQDDEDVTSAENESSQNNETQG